MHARPAGIAAIELDRARKKVVTKLKYKFSFGQSRMHLQRNWNR
jgi:hypothetical protein